ncbi:MAG: hypothetical protein ACREGC_00210 [Minisyncoccia bacterium]
MVEKTDWSFIDNRKKKEENLPSTGLSDNVSEKLDEARVDTEKAKQEIARQEYEKVKQASEKFRIEHKIQISEEELKKEDADLKKRFGLE